MAVQQLGALTGMVVTMRLTMNANISFLRGTPGCRLGFSSQVPSDGPLPTDPALGDERRDISLINNVAIAQDPAQRPIVDHVARVPASAGEQSSPLGVRGVARSVLRRSPRSARPQAVIQAHVTASVAVGR